ncbi:hypothetical protein TRICI_000284 [Trichomonascus ciferrii]|uniref:Triacylglycerol lipase n=1 Tax=Trichomonascus ciferrii TaxID=44093 RepID=A0A642VDW8_9ASCO|nr:hypothetical protein TRICI_000284 [Trichomonascus ciferrii]
MFVLILLMLLYTARPIWSFPISLSNDTIPVPVPPSDDPFYVPPDGFENEPIGTILRYRTVNNPGYLILRANVKETVELLYRTRNTSGAPIATVTTVLVPHNPDVSKVLSYQILEDASYINCAPSYGIQFKASPEAIVAQGEFLLMASALNEGWIVVTPDYQGPYSAFTAGYLSGYATLDSIRAVLRSGNITGIQPNSTVSMWGYSGGALATGWAAELQPEYAPELSIAGIAAGGYVPNITDVAFKVNRGPFASLVPAAIHGLSKEYSELEELINLQLVSSEADAFQSIQTQCLLQCGLAFAFQDWGKLFHNGAGFLTNPTAKRITSENSMGKHTPKAPMLIYHAVHDEISDIKNVDWVYDKYCSGGADIDFVRDLTTEHATQLVAGSAQAFNWLKDRMDGKPVKKGCRKRTLLSSAYQNGTLETFGHEIGSALMALTFQPLGRADNNNSTR